MKRHRLVVLLVALPALAAALFAAGTAGGAGEHQARSQAKITVMGVWTGAEQKSFQAVLDAFEKSHKDMTVSYKAVGDQLPTVLSTAVQGGNPPDVALLPQPGLMKDFVKKKALKPIAFARPTLAKNYAPVWLSLGSVNGKLYGFVFKGANKSTVWYNVKAFKDAGVKPPTTWPALLKAGKTLKSSGTKAYSIGGADGWTLTDLFENIYLRQAGPKKYDALTNHKIKWTDASVKAALRTMAKILGDTSNIAGGTSGALQTDFPTSVSQVFAASPKAAMVFEGDFVEGVITSSTKAKPTTDFNVFAFPTIGKSGAAVVGGGDTVVMFKNNATSRALISYLASPAAAEVWAKRGGFSSPNKKVRASSYPDPLARKTAIALARAKTFRFDLSDLQPAAFGGTVGQGEFKLFQDFLRKPSDVNKIASDLEKAAAKAYKK